MNIFHVIGLAEMAMEMNECLLFDRFGISSSSGSDKQQ